jgi:ribosome-binding ATPase YchF (GTP1/OBG family)
VRTNNKDAVAEDAILARIETALAEGKLASSAGLTPEEKFRIKSLGLLTLKPILYSLNGKSGSTIDGERAERVHALITSMGATYVHVDAATEHELNDVADEDKDMFRSELGVEVNGLTELIRGAYETLGLITFFTTGPKETRAWTIPAGATAPEAGAAIHNDFRDKFIRAEVVNWQKLLDDGSWSAARDKGDIRTEGKTYVFQDGDVAVFLHS